MAILASSEVAAERKGFYGRIDAYNLSPLWEVLHDLVTPVPNTPCRPFLWQWRKALPWLEEAARLITAEEAERRVLVLENPGLRGRSRISHSLYAGLQLILPGEVAPAHRHSQSALRFVVHGAGAYTAVDGERVRMEPGDFIITPSWAWHDHGNPSADPMVWLDGLDVPIVELLDAQFAERFEQAAQSTSHTEGTSFARFGNTMLPVDHRPRNRTSPLFWYPYERTREALETLRSCEDPHPCYGHKLRYVNPATGGWPMPTIATFMQLLPKGFRGKPYRSSDSTIYSVVEGTGRVRIAGEEFEWGPKDTFVVPSWMPNELQASEEAILFSFSDRAVQDVLDLWRETY